MARRSLLLVVVIAASLLVDVSVGELWVEAFYGQTLPNGTVQAGIMQSGTNQYNTYVCRFYYNNHIIPCKVETSPLLGSAWGAWNNEESFRQLTYQVLIAGSNTVISWVAAANGAVPRGAKPTGVFSSGDPLYTCRVMDPDTFGLIGGTLNPSLGACYMSFSGIQNSTTYEVLVIKET